MKTKFILLVFSVMLLLFISVSVSSQVLSVADLYNYSYSNEAAFDLRYRDKTITVRGVAYSGVTKYSETGYSVWLSSSSDSRKIVRLLFPGGNAHYFAEVNAGDEITVQGNCLGRREERETTGWFNEFTYYPVYLNSCVLVRINKTASELAREAKLAEEARLERQRKLRELQESDRIEKERLESIRREQLREAEAERKREAERLAADERAERIREAEQRAAPSAEQRAAERASLLRVYGEVKGSYSEKPSSGRTRRDFRTLRNGVLPCPEHIGEEEGNILIEITISHKGTVKSASILSKGTTIHNSRTQVRALAAARSAKFNKGSATIGTIEYHYGLPAEYLSGLSSGDANEWNLDGREMVSLVRPKYYLMSEEGQIVIDVIVDPSGTVVKASISARSTTISHAATRSSALEAARRAKYVPIDGDQYQSGSITYRFTSK